MINSICFAQTIQDIRLATTPNDGVRFVAELDKQADVSVSKLSNPPRLVLDFKKAQFDAQVLQKKWPTVGFVNACRTGNPSNQLSRIVLDFPDNCQWEEKHFSLEPQSAKNWRFVVDLKQTNSSKTQTKASTNTQTVKKKKIIVLDPGHGGRDPGAISRSGKYEKDLVLKMAKETKEFLKKLLQ